MVRLVSEVMSFVCLDSCENGITREEVLAKQCKMLRQITSGFFKVSRVPKKCTGNFKVSNERAEQYDGRESVLDSTAPPYLKMAALTRTIQSSSKLPKVTSRSVEALRPKVGPRLPLKLNWTSEARSARRGSKQAWKPESQIDARSACWRLKSMSK